MRPSARRCFILTLVMVAAGTYSLTAVAKTITLSCPAGTGAAPCIYSIDLDAGKVSGTISGAMVLPTTSATVTDSTISFIYEANMGDNGICQVRNVIDRHTAGITRTPLDDRPVCSSQYATAQCALVPDNSF